MTILQPTASPRGSFGERAHSRHVRPAPHAPLSSHSLPQRPADPHSSAHSPALGARGAVLAAALGGVVVALLVAPIAAPWTTVLAALLAALGAALLLGRLLWRRLEGSDPGQAGAAPQGGVVWTGSISSTVRLDYDAGIAEKRYEPPLLVRALYRAAFQAPFPYEQNDDALEAALHRRTIAGLLTKHWFGESMVARALDARRDEQGRRNFVTELVRGTAPRDRDRARRALRRLNRRFLEAGLPTWQVWHHNPRAVGNLIERPDGSYRIIDLESNLVTPFLPPSALVRAIRGGRFPAFDDIDVERLRDYLAANETTIATSLGEPDTRRLLDATEAYAAAAERWYASERRLLSRALRFGFRLVDVPTWVRAARRAAASGEQLGMRVLEAGIETWADEGKLSTEEAATLRRTVAEPEIAVATRHLGAHLALSVPLRFPLGSIARSLWTLTLRARAEWSALRRRGSARSARRVHSIPVALAGAIPGLGAFAYLLSKPFREQRALGALMLDQSFRKLPLRSYQRLHLGALSLAMAQPGRKAAAAGQSPARALEALRVRARLLRPHAGPVAAILAFNVALLTGTTIAFQVYGVPGMFSEPGLLNGADALQLLAAGVLGVVAFRRFWARADSPSIEDAAGIFLWGTVGLGLIVFAFDDFLTIHEHLGAFIAALLPVPILTNNVDDFITLSYGFAGLSLLFAFRGELLAPRASSALLIAGVAASALMLFTDAFGVGPVAALEFPSQVGAVALLLSAMLVRNRELRTAAQPARPGVAVLGEATFAAPYELAA